MSYVRPEIRKVWNDAAMDATVVAGDNVAPWEFDLNEDPRETAQLGGATFLGKTIDLLSRGEYASAGVVKDYLLAKPFNIKTALKGLKGEEKTTYSEDIVPLAFPDWSSWKQKALGFALSIVADPTSYLPLKLPAEAALKGARAVGKLDPVQKIKKSMDGSTLSKWFDPGSGVPKDYYELKYYAKKKVGAEQKRILKDIEGLRSGLNKKDMEDLMFFREHPEMIDDISPKLKTKLEEIGDRFDNLVDDAETNKIITPETAAEWRAKETPYVPHYYPESKAGIKLAKGEIPPGLFEKAKKPSFLKMRTFETAEDAQRLSDDLLNISKAKTIKEAQDKIREGGLSKLFSSSQFNSLSDVRSIAKMMAKNYRPEKNILKALGFRSFEQAGYKARTQFVDDVLNQFGKKIPSTTKGVPEGYGVYLPKGAIRFYRAELLDPKFIKNLKKLADEIKSTRLKSEKIVTTKTSTETTQTGAAQLAGTGPIAKMEQVMKESLINRGMTEGEASVYLGKIKANGSNAIDGMVKETKHTTETMRTVLDSVGVEGDLINLGALTEAQTKMMTGITTRVPTYALPESIAKDMNAAQKFFGDPGVTKLGRLFDKGQNAWKSMATSVRLPFHLRNMYSNWWQAHIAGVSSATLPQRLLQAASIQSGKGKNIKLGKTIYSTDEILRAAEDLGVMGKGWMGADVGKRLVGELESIVKFGKLRKLNPVDAGRKFGTMIENNSRVAVFIDQIAKGKTFKEASQKVRKYLFDYDELTETERKVFRRVLPFYTWNRKNIPLQVENLLRQPIKYQRYGKAVRAFSEKETESETKLKPEYFNKLLYVKSPFETEQGKPIYMTVDLPPLELNRMLEVRHWVNSVSPYKMFAELYFNFKAFPNISKINSQPLEKTRAPFWVSWLPEIALEKMKDNHIIDTIIDKRTGDKILGMDKKWVHGINNAFPFLTEMNRIHSQPITMSDESPEMKFKSYMTGISRTAIDELQQEIRSAYKTRSDIKKIGRFAEQHLRLPTDEEKDILLME